MTRVRGAIRLVAANLAVLAGLVVAVEFGYRLYGSVLRDRPFFREDRFLSPWFTLYEDPPPRIAADGRAYFPHRDRPTPRDKPVGTVRILAVGGSTTLCKDAFETAGVDWPQALETRLNRGRTGATYEVLNAGGDAYSTAHSLVNVELRLVEFDPDVVVLMHNVNDATANFYGDGATPDYGNKYLRPYYLNPQLQATRSFTGLLYQSAFLTRRGLPQWLADKSGDLHPDNDPSAGLRYFRRNLETLIAVCRTHGIEPVLLSQPSTLEPGPYSPMGLHVAYNRAIAEVAAEHGVTFVDMFARLGGDRRHFVDNVHYSPEGVERFAELLEPGLAPVLDRVRSDLARRLESGPD